MRAWKKDVFIDGKLRYKAQMEDEVQAQVASEAEEKRMKILALQDAIAELREQKVMELRNKEILKHKLDQVYLRGATNVEMKALKES